MSRTAYKTKDTLKIHDLNRGVDVLLSQMDHTTGQGMVYGTIRQFSEDTVKKMKHSKLVAEGSHLDGPTADRFALAIEKEMDANEDRLRRDVFQSPEVIDHFTNINYFMHYPNKTGKTTAQLEEGCRN